MSEQVTIKELLELDEKFFKGQSGIDLKVTLEKIWEAREVGPGTNKETGKPYHFFPQFMIINDGTGQIGFETTWGEDDLALSKSCKGSEASITGAKAETYEDKKGKIWRKLKGKLTLLEEPQRDSERDVSKEKPGDEKKESQTTDSLRAGYYTIFGPNDKVVVHPDILKAKDMLITRTTIAKSFIGSGKLFDKVKLEAEAWVKWIYGKGVIITTAKKESKTKKTKDNPGKDSEKSKTKKEKKTAKPLSDMVKPVGDETMGRIGRLYVEAYKRDMFKPGYELADWLNQNWDKKSLLTLTAEELKEAEKELTEMVKDTKK